MKVELWGVRGSLPTTDPATFYYGGNTSCVSVWEDGWLLILDGGSGIARLKIKNELRNNRIDILLTHLHLDHILGLGFTGLLFDPNMDIHIWGPASSSNSLHSRLSRYLSPPLFPVLLRDLPCKLTLHEIENSNWKLGPFDILSRFVIHPGPTVGYRISGSKSVFTYIPDHEPAMGPHGLIQDKHWVSGFELASKANLLFHDGQYTHKEYQLKKGWGHSSMEDAIEFASLANVNQLLLAHHDPMRTDKQLDEILDELNRKAMYPFELSMAREGTEYILE